MGLSHGGTIKQLQETKSLGFGLLELENESKKGHSPRGGAGDDGGTPVRLIFFFKRGEKMEMGERVL